MALVRFLALAAAAFVAGTILTAQSLVIQPVRAERTTETRILPLAAGSSLRVTNVNGFIRVEAWDRNEVQFTGEFRPSSKDEQVKVVVEGGKGSLEIRGEYPKHSGWGSYRGPECQMTLKVPRRVLPALETVNGEVVIQGVEGTAAAETVNGQVRALDLGDGLRAKTVNGSIHLERVKGRLALKTVNGSIQGRALEVQGVKASTVNGGIRFQSTGLQGRLLATTVNGDISFNAKGAEQVEIKKRRVSARFPGSDQAIELDTVNGAIQLD